MTQPPKPNVISIGSADFVQLTCVPNSQTQTMLCMTSVAIDHTYALCADDVA